MSEPQNQPIAAPLPPEKTSATAVDNTLLHTEKLVKEYGHRRVVNGVSITVGAGEIVGLLGPNGAGKTTTFNMVVGVIRPDEGAVKFQGREITGLAMHQRARLGIGYLTQEASVFRKLSVEENILAILETCRLSRTERAVRLKYLLEELDLTPLARSKAYMLSGGEKRRLEITRALVTSPKLMLLDEPFAGIDPIAVYEVQKIVRRLAWAKFPCAFGHFVDGNQQIHQTIPPRSQVLATPAIFCIIVPSIRNAAGAAGVVTWQPLK